MELSYSEVKNLRWGNADKTEILCDISFSNHPMIPADQFVPFCAMNDDIHDHGKEIFDRCVKGDFGKIAKYVAPKVESVTVDPVEKLRSFLSKNPDVETLLFGDSK